MARPRKNQEQQLTEHAPVVVPNKLLTVDQAAEWLGVGRTMVFEYVNDKGLPVIRLSDRVLRFDPHSMYRWALKYQEGLV
jgi:excisionase family DNA binding protein